MRHTHLTEETIKREYLAALNKLLGNRKEIFANLRDIKAELFDGIQLEASGLICNPSWPWWPS